MEISKNILFLTGLFSLFLVSAFAQNVGIHTSTPLGKLHVKGSDNTSQLIIDADTIQGNTNPLIRLRSSMGTDLLWIHSDSPFNAFMGLNTGRLNNAAGGGTGNTFIGNSSGYSNTTGANNTSLGFEALYSCINGQQNTAIGSGALRFNTAGTSNTAAGTGSLSGNTIGVGNAAFGVHSLANNTSANQNVAIGANALATQSYNPGYNWNSDNVAVGNEALVFNQPDHLTNGIQNTAIGSSALRTNTRGLSNTAIGYASLYSNATGSSNTAIGQGALYGNSYGLENTGIGYSALSSNIAGLQNTACGAFSLSNNISGDHNVAIGVNAGTASETPNLINTISIGNHGYLNAATNQTFLGNLSTAWNGGNVTWSTYSDARVKNNVREDVKGLDFITRLRPVTYYRSIKAMTDITGNTEAKEYPEKYDIEKIKFSGFLAQDVEIAAQAAGYDFSGITVPKNSKELYTLSYEQFVVPLVKAVQEQQVIIETLQEQVNALRYELPDQTSGQGIVENQQKQINDLLQRIERLEKKQP